ncbi:restriction endonuclease subunit S [Bacillus altitudinis]|uniref:restriction endonuclease subunit S n=1 Tax=Bacillus altitudinis TaxID=293387 RepID=UPI0024800C13|nr:restriction endonuclease subunit S [Bacillus altitudinis]
MSRELKDSGVEWIGKIPANWSIEKIKYTTYVKGRIGWQGLKSDEFTDEGPYLVTGKDFIGKNVNWESCHHISSERYHEAQPIQLKENDLLITKDGTIGKTAIVRDMPDKAILNSGIFVTRSAKYEVDFMYWMLNSQVFDKYIKFFETGSTIKHLYQETFENFSYPLPTRIEQKRINLFLNRKIKLVDEVIKNKGNMMTLLEKQRQSIITEAVTKGLNPNVKMKDSGVEWIGEIPEHWGTKKIKYLIQEKLLYGANESAELDDEKLPRYIRITDIDELGNLKNETFKSIPLDIANKYVVKKGDILLARSGATVGKSYIHKEEKEASYAGYLIKLRARTLELAEYIYYFTNSSLYKQWINSILIQATIQNVSAEKYANLSIPVPKDENEIKSILLNIKFKEKEILEVINKLKEQIEKLKEYRQSLIYEAVTGKIDVRDMELDEVR